MNAAEKNAHADEANAFADHVFVDEVLTEFADNMNFERKGLPEYGLKKIVRYVAQVVLARARGFEPEVLSMTDEEYMEFQRRQINALVDAGVPVIVTDGEHVISIDPEQDRA